MIKRSVIEPSIAIFAAKQTIIAINAGLSTARPALLYLGRGTESRKANRHEPRPQRGNARSDPELAELVGRIGCRYVKAGLSPPFHLHEAVRHWSGLSHDEIMAVLEKHFPDYRHLYIAGADGQHFHMGSRRSQGDRSESPVSRSIRRRARATTAKLKSCSQIHNASGTPDVFVEGRAARLVRRSESNITPPSGLVGCERTGVPINQNPETDA